MKLLKVFNSRSLKRHRFPLILRGAVLVLGLFSLAHAGEINWQTLNLTQEQQTHMQELEAGWHRIHQNLSAQIQRDLAELKTILPTGDSQKIRELQTRIMSNKSSLMNQSMDTFLKKREMLSPEQRGQLQKMLPCVNRVATPAAAPSAPEASVATQEAHPVQSSAKQVSPPGAQTTELEATPSALTTSPVVAPQPGDRVSTEEPR